MFHSRNPIYRNPTGAVQAHTNIHFKLLVPREFRCSAARLMVGEEFTKQVKTLGLFWCGMNVEDHEWWECDLHLNSPVFISTVLKLIPGGGLWELQAALAVKAVSMSSALLKESAGS